MYNLPFSVFFALCICLFFPLDGSLLENLNQAKQGDYIVTAQGKNFTLLHIYDRKENQLIVEEITVPSNAFKGRLISWKGWIMQRAPFNTAWVMYTVDLSNGKMLSYYSLTKNVWYDMTEAESFLTTLLNLKLEPIPSAKRRKIGAGGKNRPLWQPLMVVDGKAIPGVEFNAYKTEWPKDNTELSGRCVEVYVPKESQKYPSYFPYWLEISGLVGNAKIRIIDSGINMDSPASLPKKK